MTPYNESLAYNDIAYIKNMWGSRLTKYLRNFRRYNNTPYSNLQNPQNCVVGFWQNEYSSEADTSPTPSENVVKSCVDALRSKIASSKCRPFFNTIGGGFKEIQTTKAAQRFFDNLFDETNMHKIVNTIFFFSEVFDTGVLYIDDITYKPAAALPHQVYYDPSEDMYGAISRILYEREYYPTRLLPKKWDLPDGLRTVTYGVYYDCVEHKKIFIVNGSIKEIVPYNQQLVPFIIFHYETPITGSSCVSVVDELNAIQLELDTLMAKIKDASQLNPCMTFFLPEGSGIVATQLNNRVGNVVTYKPSPNMTGSPVTTSTPSFIDPQYISLHDKLKKDAYEIIGISELSAQSKKPGGLDSGVALNTMEDIESDRFETKLNNYIRLYVDIAKLYIELLPENQTILPESRFNSNVKWADIKAMSKMMNIQYSSADSLSKDPSEKLKQINQMISLGIIPKDRAAQFMELPDIDAAYSLANNAVSAVLKIIENCIYYNNFDVPDFIPFDMLKVEIINTQLSLFAIENNGSNSEDIGKLNKLFDIVVNLSAKWQMQSAITAEQDQELVGNVLTQEANAQPVENNPGVSGEINVNTGGN
ncbi:MAG TPA: hypothetical protein DCO75_02145 [Fibrobacteres bacterium]|jgi:hypothetical protein|nr:hypothetical protein [Fibrobacterota bacterium]